MRLLCLYGVLATVAGPVVADADFMSVRTQLAKDWSGKGGDPASKYFRECPFLSLCVSLCISLVANRCQFRRVYVSICWHGYGFICAKLFVRFHPHYDGRYVDEIAVPVFRPLITY